MVNEKNVMYLLASIVGFTLMIASIEKVQENILNLPFWLGIVIVLISMYMASKG